MQGSEVCNVQSAGIRSRKWIGCSGQEYAIHKCVMHNKVQEKVMHRIHGLRVCNTRSAGLEVYNAQS